MLALLLAALLLQATLVGGAPIKVGIGQVMTNDGDIDGNLHRVSTGAPCHSISPTAASVWLPPLPPVGYPTWPGLPGYRP